MADFGGVVAEEAVGDLAFVGDRRQGAEVGEAVPDVFALEGRYELQLDGVAFATGVDGEAPGFC